jgi:hypothetical protein
MASSGQADPSYFRPCMGCVRLKLCEFEGGTSDENAAV